MTVAEQGQGSNHKWPQAATPALGAIMIGEIADIAVLIPTRSAMVEDLQHLRNPAEQSCVFLHIPQ